MIWSSVTGTFLSTGSVYGVSLVKNILPSSASRESSQKLPEKKIHFAKSFILYLCIV